MASGWGEDNSLENEPERFWRLLPLLGMVAAALVVSTGCATLGLGNLPTPTPPPTPDLSGPALVVTVGGALSLTATTGVAATMADSTPLPRIDLPPRDPAAASPSAPTSRPAVSAAARAAQPPAIAAPVAPRSSPSPAAR